MFLFLFNWRTSKCNNNVTIHPHSHAHGSLLISWWRHQMETFSALLALCAGNSPVPVNSPHRGQWRGALMFSFIYAWINDWVNNREAGDLRRQRGHYDVIVMFCWDVVLFWWMLPTSVRVTSPALRQSQMNPPTTDDIMKTKQNRVYIHRMYCTVKPRLKVAP